MKSSLALASIQRASLNDEFIDKVAETAERVSELIEADHGASRVGQRLVSI